MSGAIAIGVGCRKGCSGPNIAGLVQRALHQTSGVPLALFTLVDKQDEAGLIDAARLLGLRLIGLPREALRAQTAALTRSDRVEKLFGVPGVAEAAALAGAGPGARLVLARISQAGATCALAQCREMPA